MNRDFIFGAQYYRPPTPDPEDWASDLKNMKDCGMNSVRFWVLWRWTSRRENEYYFEDIDILMELAKENGLNVTLGLICDVIPQWLLQRFPDSVMVTANGKRVEPQGYISRQIGGFPGPCFRHKEAKKERGKFIEAVVSRYKMHPALCAWDVWCEPEQCGLYREPNPETLTCYCKTCRSAFTEWLRTKYVRIDDLNRTWGRCYRDFDDTEMPKTPDLFADFIDFCNFKSDTMTDEASWRIQIVRQLDSDHPVYLHTVPNTGAIFNAVTCVDDFSLAKLCDFYGSTNFAKPVWSVATLSAGKGKLCINAECHIGGGTIRMHPKIISYEDVLRDLVPQIGMGIRGFLFWQWRPERCGAESPAWGMTKPDGTPGSLSAAAKKFIDALTPVRDEIINSIPARPKIAIWKGKNNEIFAFASQGDLKAYSQSLEQYVNTLYENNYSCCFADDDTVINELDDIQLLIMPYCYAMSRQLAEAVDGFVRKGGTLLCEAHFGGYDVDLGRHSVHMPGCGMAERWGITEDETTSSYHLKTKTVKTEHGSRSSDAEKAVAAYGVSGGKYFQMQGGSKSLIGAERFASLKSENAEVLFKFGDHNCIIKKQVGAGTIYYCGTNIGEGAKEDPALFAGFITKICFDAGIDQNVTKTAVGLHLDAIGKKLVMVYNTSQHEKVLNLKGKWRAVFHENAGFCDTVTIKPQTAELYLLLSRL